MPAHAERLLVVTPHYPLPSGMGVERRAYQHVLGLSRRWQVDLVVLYACRHSTPTGFEHLISNLVEFHLPDDVGNLPDWPKRLPGLSLLREVFVDTSRRARPLPVRQSQQFLAPIAGNNYAAAVFLRIRSWVFQPALRAAGITWDNCIVDFDDIESKRNRRIAERRRTEWGTEVFLLAKLRSRRLARFEQRILGAVDSVMLCSENDAAEVSNSSTGARVTTVPNAVPVDAPLPPSSRLEANILLVGTMGYQPNVDAAVFFCRKVLPTLQARCARPIVVWLVGHRPASEVQQLGELPNVIVTGSVPSVEPFYRAADICVAPIRSGGGTRIKILEAFAFGRAVIATRLAMEGIDAKPGEHYHLAEDAAEFADACAKLLENEDYRQRMTDAAFHAVQRRYAYETVWEELYALIDTTPGAVQTVTIAATRNSSDSSNLATPQE